MGMFFSRKGKLKKEFDEKLVNLIKETKADLQSAKVFEGLVDDHNLHPEVLAQRKAIESVHFYLYKEARIRKVIIR